MRKSKNKNKRQSNKPTTAPTPIQTPNVLYLNSGFIAFSHDNLHNIDRELTLMAWIYPEHYGDTRIFCKSIAGDDSCGYGLDTYNSSLRFLGSHTSVGVNCTSTPAGTIATNTWYHIACSFKAPSPPSASSKNNDNDDHDGNDNGKGHFKLYINGQECFSMVPTGPLTKNNLELRIGSSPVGMPNSGHFQGAMTQLSVWNIALSRDEINRAKNKLLVDAMTINTVFAERILKMKQKQLELNQDNQQQQQNKQSEQKQPEVQDNAVANSFQKHLLLYLPMFSTGENGDDEKKQQQQQQFKDYSMYNMTVNGSPMNASHRYMATAPKCELVWSKERHRFFSKGCKKKVFHILACAHYSNKFPSVFTSDILYIIFSYMCNSN